MAGLGLICVVLAVGLLGYFLRERPLLDRSRMVASAAGWNLSESRYCWASSHEIVAWNDDSDYGAMSRHDLVTGQNTPMKRITELTSTPPNANPGVELSPDTTQLLWTTRDEITAIIVCGLDGTHHSIRDDSCSWYGWLPDSRHWYELTGKRYSPWITGVTIRDTQTPKVLSFPIARISANTLEMWAVAPARLTYCTWDGSIYGSVSYVESSEVDLDQKMSRTLTHTVHFPFLVYIAAAEYSPDGTRVAWIVRYTAAEPVRALLHRLIPAISAPLHRIEGIWICRLDGSEMHEIGHDVLPTTVATTEPTVWEEPAHSKLKWLPDGQHLSFVYNDHLYTVPAD